MAKITFKAKPVKVYNMDDTLAYEYIQVPVLDRKHCDMQAFRQHPKFGPYVNSDLFKGMMSRVLPKTIRLDAIPEGVTVDLSGFLAVVSIDV